eukprot:7260187-Pyramimonas_sp.AAC.2
MIYLNDGPKELLTKSGGCLPKVVVAEQVWAESFVPVFTVWVLVRNGESRPNLSAISSYLLLSTPHGVRVWWIIRRVSWIRINK